MTLYCNVFMQREINKKPAPIIKFKSNLQVLKFQIQNNWSYYSDYDCRFKLFYLKWIYYAWVWNLFNSIRNPNCYQTKMLILQYLMHYFAIWLQCINHLAKLFPLCLIQICYHQLFLNCKSHAWVVFLIHEILDISNIE